MSEAVTVEEARRFRLRQLEQSFSIAMRTLKEFEIPPVVNATELRPPSVGDLKRLATAVESLIHYKIAIDELRKLKV